MRVAPISSASTSVITPARTARASTTSGCPHGGGGNAELAAKFASPEAAASCARSSLRAWVWAALINLPHTPGRRVSTSPSAARNPAIRPASTSARLRALPSREAARRSPGNATPTAAITHAGWPPRARVTSKRHTRRFVSCPHDGCARTLASSTTGTRRRGNPPIRRPLTDSGAGPVLSNRSVAST
ncbi:MAG TPA: hypothetical protein VK028_10050 [Micromonosporaceae bacterium]|nr:hypothetical protein [Micromonosporaceae bacterium]